MPCPDAPHRSDWLDSGFALLDSSHCVVQANRELVNWLGIRQEEALGTPLESLLQRSGLGIEEVLRRAWSEASPCAEYHFQLLPPSQGRWFRLETARNADGWFVRLSSILPPLRDLMEDGGGGSQGEDPEKQHLRLRAKMTIMRIKNI